tara:strand:+ start:870 stop:1643 length:774 start_codon:yes stop_codon:yes gene_type:complete
MFDTGTATMVGLKTTHVALIIDRSGPMTTVKRAAIDAFNEQLQTLYNQESKDHKIFATGVSFGSGISDVPAIQDHFTDKPIGEVTRLTEETYLPNGMTPMLDAMGHTINLLKKVHLNKQDAVLVILVSDGLENASREFTWGGVKRLVKGCQDTGQWTFVCLVANQDIDVVLKGFGLPIQNAYVFTATTDGVKTASHANVGATRTYFASRAAGQTTVSNFYKGTDTGDRGITETATVTGGTDRGKKDDHEDSWSDLPK